MPGFLYQFVSRLDLLCFLGRILDHLFRLQIGERRMQFFERVEVVEHRLADLIDNFGIDRSRREMHAFDQRYDLVEIAIFRSPCCTIEDAMTLHIGTTSCTLAKI